MRAADLQRLFLLAAIWGASFIFFRIIAPVLGAVWTAEFRTLIAGIALLGFALISSAKLEIKVRWKWYAIVGILNSGIPFALIAFAELHLSASLAAILNATSPLWSALVGAVFFAEAFNLKKGIGLILGILGVVVLVGWSPLEPGLQTLLSVGAMLGATLCYGIAANLTKRNLKGAPPLGSSVGSQFASSLALLLLMPFDLPRALPNPTVVLSLLALAVICTALAYILYFRLIADLGATKALSVTFLVPIFGTLWSFMFLHESIGLEKILGCAIILAGASLVTGLNAKDLGFGQARIKV
jgi:drug/metabolite transporter (DMT)-like permease